jgi:hypothetical protein
MPIQSVEKVSSEISVVERVRNTFSVYGRKAAVVKKAATKPRIVVPFIQHALSASRRFA